jgi:hypothetical protein
MSILRTSIVLVAFLQSAIGQQLVHRSSLPTIPFTETDVLAPPTPFPDPTPNAATPRFVPIGGPGFPLGDLTMDNTTGRIWETDGFLIQATPNGRYAPLAPPIPPTPSGLPPLTGLAINVPAGVLYATDGVSLFTVLATPPFPAVAPPVPFAFPAIAPPFTGLDYDSSYDLIYACDAGGYVYYFTTGGGPSGPNPVFVPPGPVPPATDLATPESILPGMYVQFLGLGVIDYTSGMLQPAAMTGIPPGSEGGLAIHAHPATLAGACPCLGSFGPMTEGVSAPSLLGAAAYGYTMSGGPPGSSVLIALDFAASPLAIGGGCTYWLPFPPFVLLPVGTNAAGEAFFPIAIPAMLSLYGVTVVAQWAAVCPTTPSGYVVSDALRAILDLP